MSMKTLNKSDEKTAYSFVTNSIRPFGFLPRENYYAAGLEWKTAGIYGYYT